MQPLTTYFKGFSSFGKKSRTARQPCLQVSPGCTATNDCQSIYEVMDCTIYLAKTKAFFGNAKCRFSNDVAQVIYFQYLLNLPYTNSISVNG